MTMRRPIALAVAAALHVSAAQAATVMTFTLDSNEQLYRDYVNTCDPLNLKGGTACGASGGALDPDQTLFAWGPQAYNQTAIAANLKNSMRSVTYAGTYAQPFVITGLHFTATGAVGRGLDQFDGVDPSNPLYGTTTGQGIASAALANAGNGPGFTYVNAADARGTNLAYRTNLRTTQMAATIVRDPSSGSNTQLISQVALESNDPASAPPASCGGSGGNWAACTFRNLYRTTDPVPTNGPTDGNARPYLEQYPPLNLPANFQQGVWYVQKPIDESYGFLPLSDDARTVNPGDQLQFEIFANSQNNQYSVMVPGGTAPVTVFGPQTVLADIQGVAEGTLLTAAMTTGADVALGNVRIGTQKSGDVTATSSGQSKTILYDLTFGGVGGDFTPTTPSAPVNAEQGTASATQTRQYTFTPTVANKGTEQTANVAIGATVGPGPGDVLTGSVKVTGTGVAPDLQVKVGATDVGDGGTIGLGRIRRGTAGTTSGQPTAANQTANLGANLTTLSVGAVTPSSPDLAVTGLSGNQVLGGSAQDFSVTLNTAGSDALGTKTADFTVKTDQYAAFGNTTDGKQFGYQVSGDVVSPLFQMRYQGADVDPAGDINLGQARQNRTLSTTTLAPGQGPAVYNTYSGIADSLTLLGVGNTTASNPNLTISGLADHSIAANNGSQAFNLSAATATAGAFSYGMTVNTDQNTAAGNKNGGEQFSYNVKGTIVQGAMGPSVDPKQTGVRFDLSGHEVVFDPACPTCVGRIDLGNPYANIRELVINNILAGSDAAVGLTIGPLSFAGNDPGNFRAVGYTPGHLIAGLDFFGIDLEYLPLYTPGGLLSPKAADKTAILYVSTDNGVALGDTLHGTVYSFLLTGTNNPAPEPGTLALFATALFFPRLRRQGRGH